MFSKHFRHALRALVFLAERAPAPCTTDEIAASTNSSATSLAKVLQALNRAGIVRTQRGAGGGVVLSRDPAHLNVREVVDATSQEKEFACFPHDAPIIAGHDCPLHRRLGHVDILVTRILRETTLAEFMPDAEQTTARQRSPLDLILEQSRRDGEAIPSLHIVGRKNSGKTTLVVDLVHQLVSRGLRVGTIKHTHHHHELDTPGKDSFRHRQAGAVAVGIQSPAMDAVFFPQESAEEGPARYDKMLGLFTECDMVLIEGGQHSVGLKVEVWRKVVSEQPLAAEERSIAALVTDDKPTLSNDTPCWPRSDIGRLTDELLELVKATMN